MHPTGAECFSLHLTEPDKWTEVPVIYWVIDPAPARPEQIHLYHKWLIKKGHGRKYTISTMEELIALRKRNWTSAIKKAVKDGNPDGPKVFAEPTTDADLPLTIVVPGVEMRVDAAGNDLNKKLVQGVSGVAGDVIEAYNGGQQMQYFAAAGMLADVTESAEKYDFEPGRVERGPRDERPKPMTALPLVEPDVQISRIRLSRKAFD